MAHLSLSLLGPPGVRLDGRLITDFHSDKVRALLAYLAVEAGRAHRREALATLLWGEYPQHNAQRSLSQALSNLRSLLAPLAGAGAAWRELCAGAPTPASPTPTSVAPGTARICSILSARRQAGQIRVSMPSSWSLSCSAQVPGVKPEKRVLSRIRSSGSTSSVGQSSW